MSKTGSSRQRADVIVGGAGFAGLALAIALRQALGDPFVVAVIDPTLARPSRRTRAPRQSPRPRGGSSRRLRCGMRLRPTLQPILDMVVTDSKLDDAVRPTFLTFGGDVEEGEPFAHMVENRHLVDALVAKAKEFGVELHAGAVAGFENAGSAVDVALADGAGMSARLLVGADGARLSSANGPESPPTDGTTISLRSSRQSRTSASMMAAQRNISFRPAICDLAPDGEAVLDCVDRNRARSRAFVALPDDEFHDELEKRFGLQLGELKVIGPRRAFPLGLFTARTFIGERLALVGDAAHIIHPIAGQGLNMGLRDVAALAEAIADAARLGLDPGGPDVLERYQRWRRFDTMTMGIATDGLNRLFSNHSDVLRLARDIGLGLVERMPALKRMFIREAAGFTGDLPKLLKGEAL